jgi:hypothetical protein
MRCVEQRKVSTPEASGERYLRRQEFVVDLDSGERATIYVQRQAGRGASGSAARQRWFLYSLEPPRDV